MTGANGYIGSIITQFALASSRYTITALSRTPTSDTKLLSLGATPVRGSLVTLDVLARESAKADIVMHLADAFLGNWELDYAEVVRIDNAAVDAMVAGLLEGKDKGEGRVLITTSGSLVTAAPGRVTDEASPLCEKPLNDRISCEKYALAQASKGIRVVAIRLAPFVYGRGGSGVRLFMGMFLKGGAAVYVGDGSTRVSTVHVDDAARLYLLVAEEAGAEGAYNATGESDGHVTVRELAEAVGEVLGIPVQGQSFEEIEGKAGRFLARFLSAENRASSAKARKELAWMPKERGILEDIVSGSYVEVAQELRGPA